MALLSNIITMIDLLIFMFLSIILDFIILDKKKE